MFDSDCDRCGACCSMLVEATYVDALREPRLYEINPEIDPGKLRTGEYCLRTYDSRLRTCRFLDRSDGIGYCQIYPTRPQDCVAVEAGDAKCQQARRIAGLPLLPRRDGTLPTRRDLEESCDFYGLATEEVFGE